MEDKAAVLCSMGADFLTCPTSFMTRSAPMSGTRFADTLALYEGT